MIWRNFYMKTLFVCIFFSALQLPCFASNLPKEIPSEIRPYEEQRMTIIDWKSADLNGDGLNDYLVVLEMQKKNPSHADIKEKQRPALIIIRQKDGSLKQVKRNDIVISCSTCSLPGGLIDGFSGITVASRTFSISNQQMGSAYQTTYTYKFGYSKRDSTWQLVQVETTQERLDSDDSLKDIRTPPNSFGKIDFADFDPGFYLQQGEGFKLRKKNGTD